MSNNIDEYSVGMQVVLTDNDCCGISERSVPEGSRGEIIEIRSGRMSSRETVRVSFHSDATRFWNGCLNCLDIGTPLISEEEYAAYVEEAKGATCPVCDTRDRIRRTVSNSKLIDRKIRIDCECTSCGSSWKEKLLLSDASNLIHGPLIEYETGTIIKLNRAGCCGSAPSSATQGTGLCKIVRRDVSRGTGPRSLRLTDVRSKQTYSACIKCTSLLPEEERHDEFVMLEW